MPSCYRFVAVFFALALLSGVRAQEPIERAAIEEELDALAAQWEDAFNRHDAHKVALTYAQDCDVEHNFTKKSGRDVIEQWTVDYFRKNPQVQTKLVNVKRVILSSAAVVESGTWTEWNHTEQGLAQEGTYISTLVKSNATWEVVHERAFSKTSSFPTFFHKVVEGSWHEQSGTQANDTYQWVLGQKFIQFTSRMGDRQTFGIIGIDPDSGELKWWSFHNDGTVELSQPVVENPLPNQHRMHIKSDTSQTDIQSYRLSATNAVRVGVCCTSWHGYQTSLWRKHCLY